MDNDCIKTLVIDEEDDYVNTRDLPAEIRESRSHVEWVPAYDETIA